MIDVWGEHAVLIYIFAMLSLYIHAVIGVGLPRHIYYTKSSKRLSFLITHPLTIIHLLSSIVLMIVQMATPLPNPHLQN